MTWLRALLIKVEGEASWLKKEVAKLQGSLIEAKDKASLTKCRALKVVVEAIKAF